MRVLRCADPSGSTPQSPSQRRRSPRQSSVRDRSQLRATFLWGLLNRGVVHTEWHRHRQTDGAIRRCELLWLICERAHSMRCVGYIAAAATLASREVDLCLIPEGSQLQQSLAHLSSCCWCARCRLIPAGRARRRAAAHRESARVPRIRWSALRSLLTER